MADYSVQETLERVLALERMKKLSDQVREAKAKMDMGLMLALMRERKEIKDKYFKVVQ